MDLEQDIWVNNEEDSKSLDIEGNVQTPCKHAHGSLHPHENIFFITSHLFHLRTTRFVQKAGTGLLRTGTESAGQTDARRRRGVEEEADGHLGEAAVEERGQRQRLHPPGRCFLLSRLFRMKTLS